MTRVEPPPAERLTAGRVLIALALLSAGGVAVRLVTWTGVYVDLRDGRTDVANGTSLVFASRLVTIASGLVIVALLVTYVVWHYSWRRLAGRYGADGRRVVRHWTLPLWRVLFLGSYVLSYLRRGRDTAAQPDELGTADLLQETRLQLGSDLIRLVSLALLMAGVMIVYRRMRGLVEGTYQPIPATPEQAYWSPRPPDDPFHEHWTDYRNPVP